MSKYLLMNHCQLCSHETQEVLSLGNIPLVDGLIDPPTGEDSLIEKYPTTLRFCSFCKLVQQGCIIEKELLFPLDYPYTSGTTQILRDNFYELSQEAKEFIRLNKKDLVVDIGCNDGTLLSNFKNEACVLGVTPENMGQLAVQKGINIIQSYFTPEVSHKIFSQYGPATIITATNVLAHFKNIDEVMVSIKELLKQKGIFISESGYLYPMLKLLQYDSIHHEHLRYYSLTSLEFLFRKYGMEVIRAKKIDTHGGSIRVYAAHPGQYPIHQSVDDLLKEEECKKLEKGLLDDFCRRAVLHKKNLHQLILELKNNKKSILGVGAPGRATVLMNYAGIDNSLIDGVVEVQGSHKIGKIIPGTRIKIVSERELYIQQPTYALMLSWHIADGLMPILKKQGFRGDFIIPLPEVRIVKNQDVP